jgi:hypothetical protein
VRTRNPVWVNIIGYTGLIGFWGTLLAPLVLLVVNRAMVTSGQCMPWIFGTFFSSSILWFTAASLEPDPVPAIVEYMATKVRAKYLPATLWVELELSRRLSWGTEHLDDRCVIIEDWVKDNFKEAVEWFEAQHSMPVIITPVTN